MTRSATLVLLEPPPVHVPSAGEFRAAVARLQATRRSRGPGAALDEFLAVVIGPNWRVAAERDLPGAAEQMERDARTFVDADLPALLAWRFTAHRRPPHRLPRAAYRRYGQRAVVRRGAQAGALLASASRGRASPRSRPLARDHPSRRDRSRPRPLLAAPPSRGRSPGGTRRRAEPHGLGGAPLPLIRETLQPELADLYTLETHLRRHPLPSGLINNGAKANAGTEHP
jgi:hypothetical protein